MRRIPAVSSDSRSSPFSYVGGEDWCRKPATIEPSWCKPSLNSPAPGMGSKEYALVRCCLDDVTTHRYMRGYSYCPVLERRHASLLLPASPGPEPDLVHDIDGYRGGPGAGTHGSAGQ